MESVRPTPSSKSVSLPRSKILVVPGGTAKVGTAVGMAVEGVGISLMIVPDMVGVATKAIVETNCGRLVGEAVGVSVSVGVGVRLGVLLGVGEGPGVWVSVSVGMRVFVAGKLIVVGEIFVVGARATAEGAQVGVGSSKEAVT